jgi:hypothetical protein
LRKGVELQVEDAQARTIEFLESKLANKNEVIAEQAPPR